MWFFIVTSIPLYSVSNSALTNLLYSAREREISMVHFLFVSACGYLYSIHESSDAFRYDIRYENGDRIIRVKNLPTELLEQGDIADGYEWFYLVEPYLVD